MCDNCSSLSREKKSRDFKLADLHATLLRHTNGRSVNSYMFGQYCRFHEEYKQNGGKDENAFKNTRKKMVDFGYSPRDAKACEDLYKKGLEVIKLLKERGIQHQPRKKKDVR